MNMNWEHSPSPSSGPRPAVWPGLRLWTRWLMQAWARMPRLHSVLLSKDTHVLRSVSQGGEHLALVLGAPQCPRKVPPSQASNPEPELQATHLLSVVLFCLLIACSLSDQDFNFVDKSSARSTGFQLQLVYCDSVVHAKYRFPSSSWKIATL